MQGTPTQFHVVECYIAGACTADWQELHYAGEMTLVPLFLSQTPHRSWCYPNNYILVIFHNIRIWKYPLGHPTCNLDSVICYNIYHPNDNLLVFLYRNRLAFTQSRAASYFFDGSGYAVIRNIEKRGRFTQVTRFDIEVRTSVDNALIFLMVNGVSVLLFTTIQYDIVDCIFILNVCYYLLD